MFDRMITQWVYGGALTGLLLLFLTPLFAQPWSTSMVLIFLHLPMYMLHQYEEHDNDRFRLFINQYIGRGKEVLTPLVVFVVNVPGVWGVIAVSTYLAAYINIGFGLIAVYLALVNAFTHMVSVIVLRRYNPGLATAMILFLPISGYTLWQIQLTDGGSFGMHALGLGLAIAIHLAIVATLRAKGAFSNK